MPWKLAGCGCLIVALSVACQPDSPSITEVEGTLDHHPERTSCHFAPEAIRTIDGEDEVVLIEFTYGGGETWSDPPGQCVEEPGPDLGGVLLAADGVSYGDSVGADGDFVTLRACETMDPQLGDCAYNMPSPVNAIQLDYLLGFTGYLTFDPPISRLSFRVCSSQSHALAAWDSIGNLVVPDTVGPSNGSSLGGDLYCDPEGWEEFGIQASGYDISRVRLRRFDPGFTAWDDMTFRREAPPGIECTSVQRGEETTCSILVAVDEVESWKFEGDSASVAGPPFVFSDSPARRDGVGRQGGRVRQRVGGRRHRQHPADANGCSRDPPRDPSKYARFSAESDVSYDTLAAACPPLLPYHAVPNALVGGANVNTPF